MTAPGAPHRPTDYPESTLTGWTDARLVGLVATTLFVLGAWPLLLVPLPPFQDLPNHVATAHIIAHPDLYPQYVFNGFFKSNALLMLWLHLSGCHGLFGAARAFTALVLAANALALPLFLLHFAGRRGLLVGSLFGWPLVHGFFVSMGFLNFAFAFALALVLLTVLDEQRQRPTVARGVGIAALSGVLWYAHPFPLAIVGLLVALHAATRASWRDRVTTGFALLTPLAPAALLSLLAAQHHLVKTEGASTLASGGFAYLNPAEIVLHFWTDVSGALTRWGSLTIVPAILLPWFAWRGRVSLPVVSTNGREARPVVSTNGREARPVVSTNGRGARPFFSAAGLGLLAAMYLALPVMISNWWYFNCRLVPFLWAGLALRLPATLRRPIAVTLAACALASSVVMGIDYVRLDRDRARFTAGMDAVPERATLLPLLFQQSQTSDFIASLTHAWGYYTVLKDTSAPLVFAIERSYPITYREFPPAALIPPALDQFAERNATPEQTCKALHLATNAAACAAAWHERWESFWRQATPRFSHVLTWAMPEEARRMIPPAYHRTFAGAANDLEIYARDPTASPRP